MDNSMAWNKFSLKINGYCNCGRDERKIRRCLRRINDTHLISIDLQNGSFTVSTINHPLHLIHHLQNILHKQVSINLDNNDQEDPPMKTASLAATGNIIDADQIPEFLDKVTRNGNLNAVNIGIRFDLKDRLVPSSSNVNQSALMVGYASPLPPLLPPPPLPPGIRPSAPKLPEKEAYGYPISAVSVGGRPPYYYGSSTSSDDYPKDYPCAIL